MTGCATRRDHQPVYTVKQKKKIYIEGRCHPNPFPPSRHWIVSPPRSCINSPWRPFLKKCSSQFPLNHDWEEESVHISNSLALPICSLNVWPLQRKIRPNQLSEELQVLLEHLFQKCHWHLPMSHLLLKYHPRKKQAFGNRKNPHFSVGNASSKGVGFHCYVSFQGEIAGFFLRTQSDSSNSLR